MEQTLTGERADLLETLRMHRALLRGTARDLTDEQAATRSTVSELTVGGLIKHVALMESQWVDFIEQGTSAMESSPDDDWAEFGNTFRMLEGETLQVLLDRYDEIARRTDEVVATLPDLDLSHPLPEAPWFPPGARRSARRVFMGLIAEIAQHAGHADIIREAIDGQKSMG
ncbi:DinB family protein [Pseudonocardia humida]|uniref:DinB family protein n=1 Tax=Pseudonocardia humida TaxID=2800819 RepID=A0ABT1A3Y1_9PSEU|nr:DinB family protein [Pseudonocardia humida]MCO1657648.1 DinB family protein [Pseudonocardia humida]